MTAVRLLLPLAAVVLTTPYARAESLAELPPPPPGRYVLDTTGSVEADTQAKLEAIAAEVDARGQGQLAVVVIRTTGGRDHRAFATDLFNAWGIGDAARDDGALLFVAVDDRAAEIVLGDGVDDSWGVARSAQVMQGAVVPGFRRGDPAGALIDGAKGIAQLLAGSRINATAAADDAQPPRQLDIPHPRPGWVVDLGGHLQPELKRALNELAWAHEADTGQPLVFVFFDQRQVGFSVHEVARQANRTLALPPDAWLVVLGVNPPQADLRTGSGALVGEAREDLEELRTAWRSAISGIDPTVWGDDPTASPLWTVAERTRTFARTGALPRRFDEQVARSVERNKGAYGGGLAGALVFGGIGLRRWLRRRPRRCQSCGTPRQLLDEASDDPHLAAGQQWEETLSSVDYDVWWCNPCNDALVLRYGRFFSSHKRCHSCDYVTARQRTRTITYATYDHGGLVEVTETCDHCGHRRQYGRHTPRLTRSSTSSSSSRSSGSSSFRGGSSSGRGSSGRW